ncbi:hypothetical protein B296_00014343 [Ensete ventricosum]|uniref:Uncharacterized protein n=1 Tax=Ensete ventricosum TaxID=4639 RepID=A0A426ZDM3_ENSVE|nr:hypothetical protein B296_00014343 [Ensete ventricosum]
MDTKFKVLTRKRAKGEEVTQRSRLGYNTHVVVSSNQIHPQIQASQRRQHRIERDGDVIRQQKRTLPPAFAATLAKLLTKGGERMTGALEFESLYAAYAATLHHLASSVLEHLNDVALLVEQRDHSEHLHPREEAQPQRQSEVDASQPWIAGEDLLRPRAAAIDRRPKLPLLRDPYVVREPWQVREHLQLASFGSFDPKPHYPAPHAGVYKLMQICHGKSHARGTCLQLVVSVKRRKV